jgi:hypothetical protein
VKLAKDALIASEKLTGYLLVRRPVGDKSEFLRQAGYTLDNWQELEKGIRQQILTEEARPLEKTSYGELFEIRALLTGPNGRALRVRTVWIQERGTAITKFITLYPDRGGVL